MLMPGRPGRAYKEITLQQLRSFCETVRLGSLTAAADSLGLARPTVWKQVHALEHHLGIFAVRAPPARGIARVRRHRQGRSGSSPIRGGQGRRPDALAT